MTDQMTMSGADWLSDRDRKAQARLEALREKTGRILARRLDAAVEALRDYMNACNEIGDESRVKHAADGRLRLQEDCAEYANWLHSVHGE